MQGYWAETEADWPGWRWGQRHQAAGLRPKLSGSGRLVLAIVRSMHWINPLAGTWTAPKLMLQKQALAKHLLGRADLILPHRSLCDGLKV